MKPKRFYHDWPGMTWLHIKRCQLRVVLQWLGGALIGEDQTDERPLRRGLGRRASDVAPWSIGRYGPDITVRHIPGRTDDEIVNRLIGRMQGHEEWARLVVSE